MVNRAEQPDKKKGYATNASQETISDSSAGQQQLVSSTVAAVTTAILGLEGNTPAAKVVRVPQPDGDDDPLILLGGGSTHDVLVRTSGVPAGTCDQSIELAHGATPGYVQGGQVTIIDRNFNGI